MHRGVTVLDRTRSGVGGGRVRGAVGDGHRRRRARHPAGVRRHAVPRAVGDRPALDAAGVEAVYRIGDCVAPRTISEAIFDGYRMAREIDGPDPSVAPRLDRERNVPDIDLVATR